VVPVNKQDYLYVRGIREIYIGYIYEYNMGSDLVFMKNVMNGTEE
jgi:hypothetical protein